MLYVTNVLGSFIKKKNVSSRTNILFQSPHPPMVGLYTSILSCKYWKMTWHQSVLVSLMNNVDQMMYIMMLIFIQFYLIFKLFLQWIGICHASCVMWRLSTSSQELLGQSLPNWVCSICRVRRQEILNFITPTPKRGNFGVKSVKLMYFFKNLLLYSQA